MSVTRVGVAVVEQDGRFLVGIRAADATLPGQAEFPGGKCLPGESFADAAVRECRDETGLTVDPVERLDARTHRYSHGTVQVEFWRCLPIEAEAFDETSAGFRWIPAGDLAELDFPAANREVVATLAKGIADDDEPGRGRLG